MMRTKFTFLVRDGQIQSNWTFETLREVMLHFKNGEIIIRERPDWNTDQMRKYFYGPCTDFLLDAFASHGISMTKEDIKVWFKENFVGYEEAGKGAFRVSRLRSLASLTRPEWYRSLRLLDQWCMDNLNTCLPPADHVAESE